MSKKDDTTQPKTGKFFVVKKIQTFKSYLKRQGIQGLAIDIDETISFTLLSWEKYLIKRFGNPENLTVLQIHKKYGYFQNYWTNPKPQKWMENAINDNNFQKTF